jgi:hypothetical protein
VTTRPDINGTRRQDRQRNVAVVATTGDVIVAQAELCAVGDLDQATHRPGARQVAHMDRAAAGIAAIV